LSEPWFKKAFEGHYLEVYAHRNLQEAQAHLPQIIQLAQLEHLSAHSKILDLGCGQGRYSILLKNAGYRIVGLDYSKDLLNQAKSSDPAAHWLRGNMLQLPFRESFDRVLSLFTSFGYFDVDEMNLQVLQEMASCLKLGGLLYLDYLNPQSVQASPWARQEQGDYFIHSQKNVDTQLNMIHKDVEIFREDQLIAEYQERVKLYGQDWFQAAANLCSLNLDAIYGDYEKSHYSPMSPRQIMIFRKI
jgi:SAM-dependent methyltransferase